MRLAMMGKIASIVLLTDVAGCFPRSPEQAVIAAYKGDRASIAGDSLVCTKPSAHRSAESMDRDTAIVRVFQDCVKPAPPRPAGPTFGNGSSVRVETDYLVVRRNGRWKVERPLAGGVSIPM